MIGLTFYDAKVKANGKDVSGLIGQTDIHEKMVTRDTVNNGQRAIRPTGTYGVKMEHAFCTSEDTLEGDLGSVDIEIVDGDFEYTFSADKATLSKTGKQEGFQWYALEASGSDRVSVIRRD